DRHARQWRVLPSLAVSIYGTCAGAGTFAVDSDESVQRGIEPFGPRERLVAQFCGRTIPAAEGVPHFSQRSGTIHQRTRGTRKKPAWTAGSGAFARASPRSSDGRATSARSGSWPLATLAVGGTPVVSISWTCRAYSRKSPSSRARRSISWSVSC